eukprot:CAMPEP_0179196272 /NCGR_PEP_ID=MMETSP0796-20121207/97588_1 /TAXON_ID=73915 /ORGANISM="Pyrodinium bahamense, Strain pbaha01" /LENGTH=59 /DNA_ID=CAMNT_0020900665 /DNA_START=57 /DNA_END=233 /DNA_ORIENTATION=+
MLTGRIDDENAKQVAAQLLYLEGEGSDTPITLYINSGGGDVHAGLYIYDVMQHISSPVR